MLLCSDIVESILIYLDWFTIHSWYNTNKRSSDDPLYVICNDMQYWARRIRLTYNTGGFNVANNDWRLLWFQLDIAESVGHAMATTARFGYGEAVRLMLHNNMYADGYDYNIGMMCAITGGHKHIVEILDKSGVMDTNIILGRLIDAQSRDPKHIAVLLHAPSIDLYAALSECLGRHRDWYVAVTNLIVQNPRFDVNEYHVTYNTITDRYMIEFLTTLPGFDVQLWAKNILMDCNYYNNWNVGILKTLLRNGVYTTEDWSAILAEAIFRRPSVVSTVKSEGIKRGIWFKPH